MSEEPIALTPELEAAIRDRLMRETPVPLSLRQQRALLAALDAARQDAAARLESVRALGEEAQRLQAQLAAAREALRTYGTHVGVCYAQPRVRCICGLDAALAALDAPGAGEVGR